MSVERETSVLEINDKEIQDYQWDFKIPPKSRIMQNISAIANAGFTFTDLKFTSGILSRVDHQMEFAVYTNQINAYLSLPRRNQFRKYTLHPSKLELLSKGQIIATHAIKFVSDEASNTVTASTILWASKWVNTDESWNDAVDVLRLTLSIECESIGRCVRYLKSDLARKINNQVSALELDATEFFMSDYMSDVVFVCKDQEFPAHRFLLICKSSVFRKMFQHEMKESKEGRVVIEDMEPPVLKELLRFMYAGKVEKLEEICLDLFIAADKYDLETLKGLCELVLLSSVTAENALEMYTLADTHRGIALIERAVEVLKRNKTEVVGDSSTFQEFSQRYPELMFELYKL